jgi:hypothetical protein
MEELGYAKSRMLFYKNGNVCEEVWDVLLYEHLSSTKIGDRRALMEAHKRGDYEKMHCSFSSCVPQPVFHTS